MMQVCIDNGALSIEFPWNSVQFKGNENERNHTKTSYIAMTVSLANVISIMLDERKCYWGQYSWYSVILPELEEQKSALKLSEENVFRKTWKSSAK